jgi:thymidylate synthase
LYLNANALAFSATLHSEPKQFPTLHLKREVRDIGDFTFEDFEIRDYDPYPAIKMDMAI